MANELSTVLKTTYAKELKMVAQQSESRIIKHTDNITGVGGETWVSQKLNKSATETANAPALGSDHGNLAVNHSKVNITLAPKFSPTYLYEHEMNKFSASAGIRKGYAKNQLGNINRYMDTTAITALLASNTPLAVAASNDALGSGNFTYNKILEAMERLDSADYDNNGYKDIVCVIGSKQVRDLRSFIETKSTDYDKISELSMGKVVNLWGITFINTNLLSFGTGLIKAANTGTNGTRKCYMFDKNAVESAFVTGSAPKSTMDWIPEKSQFLINSSVDMGVGVVWPTGVIQIEAQELVLA